MYYDDVDKSIIEMLQGDIPLEPEPYKELAERLNISQTEVLKRIAVMTSSQKIRRLGAVMRHRESGFLYNAMLVFKASTENADEAGEFLSALPQVTHCYLREVPDHFGYNLFAMVHLKKEEDLKPILDNLMQKPGLNDYQVIKSLREFKKVSMKYI